MKTNYAYTDFSTQKIKQTIKMKLINLGRSYNCNFLSIDQKTTEGEQKTSEGLLIAVNGEEDIDEIINQLKQIKKEFKKMP